MHTNTHCLFETGGALLSRWTNQAKALEELKKFYVCHRNFSGKVYAGQIFGTVVGATLLRGFNQFVYLPCCLHFRLEGVKPWKPAPRRLPGCVLVSVQSLWQAWQLQEHGMFFFLFRSYFKSNPCFLRCFQKFTLSSPETSHTTLVFLVVLVIATDHHCVLKGQHPMLEQLKKGPWLFRGYRD